MTVKGIDVSSHNPTDYATSGLSFVFVKATEGTTYVNPKWVAQVARARAAGVVVGHYHYARSGSIAEADHFLETIAAHLKASDVLILDWEETAVSCAEKDAWLKHVKAKQPKHRVLLYCNTDYQTRRNSSGYAADGLWIAQYNGHPGAPSITAPWLIHQYSSDPIDKSLARFESAAAMHAWANPQTAGPKYPGHLLRVGTSDHDNTKVWQRRLNAIAKTKLTVDGQFGPKTDHATRAFQHAHHLEVDGVVGPHTWRAAWPTNH